jgi:hypothetical protein
VELPTTRTRQYGYEDDVNVPQIIPLDHGIVVENEPVDVHVEYASDEPSKYITADDEILCPTSAPNVALIVSVNTINSVELTAIDLYRLDTLVSSTFVAG